MKWLVGLFVDEYFEVVFEVSVVLRFWRRRQYMCCYTGNVGFRVWGRFLHSNTKMVWRMTIIRLCGDFFLISSLFGPAIDTTGRQVIFAYAMISGIRFLMRFKIFINSVTGLQHA